MNIFAAFRRSSTIISPRSRCGRDKIQAVKCRALHYFLCYLLTCGPSLAVILIGGGRYHQYHDTPDVLSILSRFLFPLQGFLSVCIHLHPQVKSIRQSNSEYCYVKGFCIAIKTYDDSLDDRQEPQRTPRISRVLSARGVNN